MKLTQPSGVTACRGDGEQGEQDSRNNRLRPEKFLWMRFRTGVQLSPPPPKNKGTCLWQVPLFFWLRSLRSLHPFGIEMLGAAEPPLCKFILQAK